MTDKTLEQEAQRVVHLAEDGLIHAAEAECIDALRRAEARGIRRAADVVIRFWSELRLGSVEEQAMQPIPEELQGLADAVEKGEA